MLTVTIFVVVGAKHCAFMDIFIFMYISDAFVYSVSFLQSQIEAFVDMLGTTFPWLMYGDKQNSRIELYFIQELETTPNLFFVVVGKWLELDSIFFNY